MDMNHLKDFIIQYESWQYECCGEFFKIGDIVKWPAHKDGDEYWYAAHGGAELQVEGKIIEIVALYRTTTGDFHTFQILGERIESIADSDSAFLEAEEQENTEERQGTENFYCYIIRLEHVTVFKIKSSIRIDDKNDEEKKQIEYEDYIEIIKGHDPGGYFWIMPVKYEPKSPPSADYWHNWKEYKKYEISIDEQYISSYLLYFLLKYFNPNLEANQKRRTLHDEGCIFIYYLEHNFFSYREVDQIISDIQKLLEIVNNSSSKEDFIAKTQEQFPPLKKFGYNPIDIAKDITDDIYSFGAVADFYHRFIKEMKHMMNDCTECDIISFMGP